MSMADEYGDAEYQCHLCPARYSDPVDRDECEAEHAADTP